MTAKALTPETRARDSRFAIKPTSQHCNEKTKRFETAFTLVRAGKRPIDTK